MKSVLLLMLFSVPSRWEKSEDGETSVSPPPTASPIDTSSDKAQVTSEVLKRAENAIFKKAINAIRPPGKKDRRTTDRPVDRATDRKVFVDKKDEKPPEKVQTVQLKPLMAEPVPDPSKVSIQVS
jgi:hypothetical protein